MSRTDVMQYVGYKHLMTITGHQYPISALAWSPDGTMLATSSYDQTICIWEALLGQLMRKLKWGSGWAHSIAWAPDGHTLAGAGVSGLRLWDPVSGEELNHYEFDMGRQSFNCVTWSPSGAYFAAGSKYSGVYLWKSSTGILKKLDSSSGDSVRSLAWSPDGRRIAYAVGNNNVYLWDVTAGEPLKTLVDPGVRVNYVIWSKDGESLVSGCDDATIRIWDYKKGLQTGILEGHTNAVACVTFSADGMILAGKGVDGAMGLWRTDTWEQISSLPARPPRRTTFESSMFNDNVGISFNPTSNVLAAVADSRSDVRIWQIDFDTLARSTHPNAVHYTNAKVVLVGDTGVGKSGLALALTKQPFTPTESTHGRRIWTLNSENAALESGATETREILLWDLAGQPGYRLIHQLHLNEVVVALVVFDGRNESDPFSGVRHWNRAIRHAQVLQGTNAYPVKKFLVAARMDRGGVGVSRERIRTVVNELDFDGYFVTSAKEYVNIEDLAQAIRDSIEWELLPRISSTQLFQSIKDFIVVEQEDQRYLTTQDDLFRAFMRSTQADYNAPDLRQQFDKCIGRMESRGLIRRLSFGGLVLMRPELLDSYASALISSIKDEPDGLGSIAEERVLSCMFSVPSSERVRDRDQEKLLLIAMVEDLIRHELALREYSDDGPYLVFPSQSTRENPDLLNVEGQSIIFDFEGAIYNVYATLAVRLSHSGAFERREQWQNAVTFNSKSGICGIYLQMLREGHGRLTLFFEKSVTQEARKHFEWFIKAHLERRALRDTIVQKAVVKCPKCDTAFTDEQVQKRRRLGYSYLDCLVCEWRVSLDDDELPISEEPLLSEEVRRAPAVRVVQVASRVEEMTQAADKQRELDIVATMLQGKREVGSYDVFLCHNGEDKAAVKNVGQQLLNMGILPWLDEWELRPGLPWQTALEKHISTMKTAAIFVGKSGIGPWQQVELEALLREMVSRGCPVIPVLLAGASYRPDLPVFLRGLQWVDFNQTTPDPMSSLVWGITGERMD